MTVISGVGDLIGYERWLANWSVVAAASRWLTFWLHRGETALIRSALCAVAAQMAWS